MVAQKTGKNLLRLTLWATVGCILITLFPYAKAELLTRRHGQEFEGLYKLTGMISEIEYFKVISYTETQARVFYVSQDHAAGNLLTFSSRNNEWVLEEWETVWSTSGSAGRFMWPFYR